MRLSNSLNVLLLALSSLSLSFAANDATTARSIAYNGVKVLRVPTGASTAALYDVVSRLELTGGLWTELVSNSHLDLEVPQDKFAEFLTAAEKYVKEQGLQEGLRVMHKDLGQSIRQESEQPEQRNFRRGESLFLF